MIRDLVLGNRSYRRFYQEHSIERETLRELVDLARFSGSASNRQPLKYILTCEPKKNALVFAHLSWAMALKDWPGPSEGERPSGYITILLDTKIGVAAGCDHGIAAQSILLGAREKGLGGCMLAAIKKEGLRNDFEIPERYEILLVIALGKPKEIIKLENMGPDDGFVYWNDAEGVHHVPKRALEDIIIG